MGKNQVDRCGESILGRGTWDGSLYGWLRKSEEASVTCSGGIEKENITWGQEGLGWSCMVDEKG